MHAAVQPSAPRSSGRRRTCRQPANWPTLAARRAHLAPALAPARSSEPRRQKRVQRVQAGRRANGVALSLLV